ncbi:MAG: hypothetical protein IT541_17445 [Hyphomicrobiales bacterium]|nr:hypothetical protein [Hyphomicrobiales bacterium]
MATRWLWYTTVIVSTGAGWRDAAWSLDGGLRAHLVQDSIGKHFDLLIALRGQSGKGGLAGGGEAPSLVRPHGSYSRPQLQKQCLQFLPGRPNENYLLIVQAELPDQIVLKGHLCAGVMIDAAKLHQQEAKVLQVIGSCGWLRRLSIAGKGR